MSYWTAVCVVLIAVIIAASLTQTPTRRRYMTAAWCFAIISFGSAFFAVFPMFFGIGMANAFGPRSVSPVAYVLPILSLVAFGYSALSLFPFMSAERGRKVVLVVVALAALWAVWAFVSTIIRWPQSQGGGGPTGAIMAFFYLLLWLRVYDLRCATDHP